MTAIASLLAAAALKGTVLLLILAALAATMRRSSASTRHLVWSLGLTGLMLLPALSLTIPWRLPLIPAPVAEPQAAAPAGNGAERHAAPPLEAAREESVATAPGETAGVFFGGSDGTVSAGSAAAPLPGLLQEETQARGGWSLGSVLGLALKVWLAGVVLLLGYLLLGALAVRLIVRRGTPLRDFGWIRLLHDAQEHLGVEAPVRLVASPTLPMPVTAGILRPVIVLPRGSEAWDEERRWAVLLHELAHVQRRDLVSHLIARLACACHWFNPLVWYSAKRLRAESERACDDLVLTSGEPAAEYADHLLQIVRAAGYSRTPAVAVPMAQRSEFEGRLLAILEPRIKRHRLSLATGLMITLLVGLTAVPLAAIGRATGVAPATPTAQRDTEATTPAPAAAPRLEATVPKATDHEAEDAESTAPETALTDSSLESLDGVSEDTPTVATLGAPDLTPSLEAPPAAKRQASGGADPVPVLVRALGDSNAEVREAALRALGDLEDPRAIPALVEAVDRYPAQRLEVLRALAEFKDPRVPAVAARMLSDRDAKVREASIRLLARAQDTTAIAALARALRTDADAQVRRAAARALGEIDDPRAIPALAEALASDTNLEVRKMAVWALGEIEDPSSIDAIGAALGDANADLRIAAARALGEIDDRRATPLLIPVLRDSDPKVRERAIWALAEIEDPMGVEPIGAALKDQDITVRRQAARALGNIEDARAVPLLIPATKDADVEVRKYAVWALGEIEDIRAVDALTEALGDAHPDVRSRAAHALGHMEHPSAAPGLRRALGDANPTVRRQAADALGDIKLSAAPAELIAALKDSDIEVRKLAANSLGDIEDPASATALAAAVNDENREVRLRALRALGEIKTQSSIDVLVKAMDDPDPEVRAVAARLLGRRR